MSLKSRFIARYRIGGFFHAVYKTIDVAVRGVTDFLALSLLRAFSTEGFVWKGKRIPYFYHLYNTTWKNERMLEVALAQEVIRNYGKEDILEVGNTLAHYFPFPHDVVDKYEVAEGVANEDVVDFKPAKKYGLIVTVSTMEHVGWDEERDATKILRGFLNLRDNCLAAGGTLFATMPLGCNDYLDAMIRDKALPFTETHFFRRGSKSGDWVEFDGVNGVGGIAYGSPFGGANGIIVGIIRKK